MAAGRTSRRSAAWATRTECKTLTLFRPGRARMDVSATAALTSQDTLSPIRIAHQVRQDIWRALARVRGYSPVVQVVGRDGALIVTAGGMLTSGNVPHASIKARLSEVLQNPANRARWCRFARVRRVETKASDVED